jgi:hypothetical protein
LPWSLARVTSLRFYSLRAGLLGLVLTLFAACQTGTLGGGATKIALFGGTITVAAPPGYCISPGNVSQTGEAAVVLIGKCSDASTSAAAVVTVSVGQPGSAAVMAAGPQALSAFFTSAQGRATLARSARAQDVTVRKALMAGPNFLMLVADRVEGTYWRAIMGIRGRAITVSAIGTRQAPLSPEASRALVDGTLKALLSANQG